MKSPLRKRLLRELKQEFGKYMVIFLLLTASIGFVSGFLVADGSMIRAYEEGFEQYNIEDGNFRTPRRLNQAQITAIEESGVKLYDLFYAEEQLTTNESKLRIFQNREEINRLCVMQGRLPEKTGEIAIDRMYAHNNAVEIGDTLQSASHTWTVTGLVAFSDYSCLFENNGDTMFDASQFGVAVVSQDTFSQYSREDLNYCYAWKYDSPPTDDTEANERSEDFLDVLNAVVSLKDYIPQYMNQAIRFTGNDMGSDRGMMIMLLYIIIAIMAFVFTIITNNTIQTEANVIGTLLASGYTKRELIAHYMAMPTLVTLISAVLGNLAGYSFMKKVCVNMYYGSYSLPTYVTVWNGEAFILTTVISVLMMVLINYIILRRKLSLPPLKFLRRDLRRRKQKRSLYLPSGIPFFKRFQLRVILQNAGSYLVLFIGILFANLLLIFGLALPDVLHVYQDNLQNNMLCRYQYILQMPYDILSSEHQLESIISLAVFELEIQTDNEDAEKFSAYTLKTADTGYKSEDIMLYGVEKNSRYITMDHSSSGVMISSTYAEKYDLEAGDHIVLKEAFRDKKYELTISGIYDYQGSLAVFMDQKDMNRMLKLDDAYFSGYFSDSKITDIKEEYIGTVIDLNALTKVSRQLNLSMGQMMYIVDGFAVAIFAVLIYLLSKIILEKNAQSISMAKIFGYSNSEINRLYILSTSVVVIACLLASLPIETKIVKLLFTVIMRWEMTGWIPMTVRSIIYIKMFLIGSITYAAVAVLEYRKIQRVPMDAALKNVE